MALPMGDKPRTSAISSRISPETLDRLDELCSRHKLTRADIIEILVNREYELQKAEGQKVVENVREQLKNKGKR